MATRTFKHLARRLACYLHTVGLCPELDLRSSRARCAALMAIYLTLPRELRREARRRGREVIRSIGLHSASSKLFPCNTIQQQIKVSKQERAEQLAALLRQSSGRCPVCCSWRKGKRVWPTRELAESFLPFAGDTSLRVYECRAVPGTFHTGHDCSSPQTSNGSA
jgi:hypothetical protein